MAEVAAQTLRVLLEHVGVLHGATPVDEGVRTDEKVFLLGRRDRYADMLCGPGLDHHVPAVPVEAPRPSVVPARDAMRVRQEQFKEDERCNERDRRMLAKGGYVVLFRWGSCLLTGKRRRQSRKSCGKCSGGGVDDGITSCGLCVTGPTITTRVDDFAATRAAFTTRRRRRCWRYRSTPTSTRARVPSPQLAAASPGAAITSAVPGTRMETYRC